MPKPRMYWWEGSDLVPFVTQIMKRGLENVRVEFHVDTGLLHVVDKSEATTESHEPGTNFVHVCPPSCPDDE